MGGRWENFYLDQSLGFVMHRALTSIKAKVRKEFQRRDCNVTIDQWVILCALWEKDGQSQAELTEKTFKDRPTVTRMLDLLEKKGLVVRKRSATDRRVYNIFLTSLGQNFQSKLVPIVIDLHAAILKGFSQSETAQLYAMLNRLFDNTRS